VLRARIRSRLADEGGFTLIEGLVAGLVLVIGLLASIGVFEGSAHESATGERQQVAVEQAQAELERLRDLPYDQLAIDQGQPQPLWPPAPSGTSGNPAARVAGAFPSYTFTASPSGSEPVVLSAAAGTGIKPFEQIAIQSFGGGNTLSAHVYRFISWRDENCELVDITGLTSGFDPLLAQLDQLLADIDPITSQTFALLDEIAGPGSLLDQLIGFLLDPLRNDFIDANTLLDNLRNVLDIRRDDIQDARDQLQALRDGLVEIDPCDLDVGTLRSLQQDIQGMEVVQDVVLPVLDQLDGPLEEYRESCVVQLNLCLGEQQPVLTALDNLEDDLDPDQDLNPQGVADQLDQVIDGVNSLNTALEELNLPQDSPCNTKRLTVAVVLDPRTAAGPRKPIWATSVASDPEAGLGTGAPC
jgi:Tfp pilus assembly protein PilV